VKSLGFRTRLAVLHTAAVACFLGLATLSGHWALAKLVLGQLDAALLALAETEASALQADPRAPVRIHEFAPGTAPPSFARLDRFVQIADLDGRVLAWSGNLGTARLPLTEPTLSRLRQGEIVFETYDHFGEEPIRLAAIPVSAGPTRYVVQVAGSLDDAYGILGAGRWLFAGLSAALLVAVAFTSTAFARRALQPVDDIVARARGIGEANLAERLPHPGSGDELGRLVETLNAMLERVERGVETQRRFTADASHELRSPLSRMRAELEVTLRRPREALEYEEALRSCLEEVEGLSRLTEELLTLAHLDADRDSRPAPAVPLLPIVDDALRRVGRQAERRGVRVSVGPRSPQVEVRASPMAVGVALTNLLDNALKFSPAGSEVNIGVSVDGAEAVIAVSDSGPGIAAGDVPALFDRFHRGAAARLADAPGSGLGLAICKAAVERHGGRIAAENGREGGARFSIRLPLAC
jgi:two-component system, OmpR family, sensor kinase